MEKRVIYFGTNGNPGHGAIPIQGKFSNAEIQRVNDIDILPIEKYLNGRRSLFFKLDNYCGFLVPYSPDDRRPGSKTIILIENGDMYDVVRAIENNKFVKKQFLAVFNKYKYSFDEGVGLLQKYLK